MEMLAEKKDIFPPSYDDEGGVEVRHQPTEEEKRRCVFADRADADCPAKKDQAISCTNCSYHPWTAMLKEYSSKPGSRLP